MTTEFISVSVSIPISVSVSLASVGGHRYVCTSQKTADGDARQSRGYRPGCVDVKFQACLLVFSSTVRPLEWADERASERVRRG